MKTKLICLLIALSSATAMWAERIWFGNLCYETTSDSTVCVTYQRLLYYGTENNYNKLTSVTIPSSIHDSGKTYRVTGIGDYTFDGCKGLTSITIPDGITYIGQDAFRGCTGLTSITMPNSVTSVAKDVLDDTQWYKNQSDGLVYINNILYKYKGTMPNNTNVIIKEGTAAICSYAFSDYTGLTSISIPNSVTGIGEHVFSGCSGLTSIVVESGNTIYDSRNNCNAIIETATNTLMHGCGTTIIPNSVTSIGYRAFFGCTGLTSITIPNSVTSIDTYAFSDCTHLTSVTIPNSVTSIGSGAFQKCKGLTSVIIGNNNELKIESYAFVECENLTSVTCYANVPPIIEFYEREEYIFDDNGHIKNTIIHRIGAFDLDRISSMVRLFAPVSAISAYKEAEEWKDFGRIAPIGATTIDTDNEQLVVQPTFTDVTITWKIVPNAETYTIAITHGTETVCTLVFNADGQLTNIAFAAPSRYGTPRHAPAAVMTEQGYQFTVTGLEVARSTTTPCP